MRPRKGRLGSRQTKQEAVMRLRVMGTVIAIATVGAFSTKAADLAYPPAPGSPQYDVAPAPGVTSPQVIIVPAPSAPPQYYYNGAPVPPPVIGSPPYGVAPPAVPGAGVAPGTPLPP